MCLRYRYGKRYQFVNSCGFVYTYTYNENGKLESVITPRGIVRLRNTYDSADRVIKQEMPEQIIFPDRSCLYIDHDEKGDILSIRNSYGTMVRYEYDNLNRVKAVVNGEGNRIQYEYDERNNLLKIIHPDGNFRSYTYNEKGKPVQIQDFDGETINIEYDVMGLPEKQCNKEGRETIKIYDKMGNN